MSDRNFGFLMAMTTATCWSILAIALKFSLNYASSGSIVWVRMLVAALVGFFLFAIKRPEELSVLKKPPFLSLLAGVFLAFNYFGYMKGIELTSASNAQIMIQSGPLLLALIGVFYFKERLSFQQWLGVLCAVVGFTCFYWSQFQMPSDIHVDYFTGNLWIWAAAITWASYGAFQKILMKKCWSPQQVNLIVYIVSAVALVGLADFPDLLKMDFWGWLLLIILGVNTLIAYGALGEALKRIPAAYVSMIICMNPLITLSLLKAMEIFGIHWVAPEPLDWISYLGAFCVVFGVVVALTLSPKSRANT